MEETTRGDTMTWELGNTSKRFEVGLNGGPDTISSGKGDHGR